MTHALLTKREVAARCKVCLRVVDNWMARNAIGYVKIGRSVRFTAQDVDRFIQKHRIGREIGAESTSFEPKQLVVLEARDE
jgi:excisionase family DNA binding protein